MREQDGSKYSVSTSLAPQTSSEKPPRLSELRGVDCPGLRIDLQPPCCAQVRLAALVRTRFESADGPAG